MDVTHTSEALLSTRVVPRRPGWLRGVHVSTGSTSGGREADGSFCAVESHSRVGYRSDYANGSPAPAQAGGSR